MTGQAKGEDGIGPKSNIQRCCFLLAEVVNERQIVKPENAKEMAPVKTAHRLGLLSFCLALILVLLTGAVSEADCVQDALAKVEGAFLAAASGAVYRIINTNGVELAFWVPGAAVTICDQFDMRGEPYYSIFNQDANQTVFAVRQR